MKSAIIGWKPLQLGVARGPEMLLRLFFPNTVRPHLMGTLLLVRFLPLVIDHNHGYKSLPW